MSTQSLVLVTRRSPLALAQARFVEQQLISAVPAIHVSLSESDTVGDRITTPLRFIGGKGLFLKDLESRLLAGTADCAVHSLKDVPSDMDDRFCLPVLNWRADPSDACVLSPHYTSDVLDLNGRTVATSSRRRAAQLRHLWPSVRIVDVRGNVGTRLFRMAEEGWDALILASAGLARLQLVGDYRIEYFDPQLFLPAVGQGILTIEVCRDRPDICSLLSVCDDRLTRYCGEAEREVSLRLGADCSSMLGAFAWCEGESLLLKAAVFSEDGGDVLTAMSCCALSDSDPVESVAHAVVDELKEQGAVQLMALGS